MKSEGLSGMTTTFLIFFILILVFGVFGGIFWLHKNRSMLQYRYKRSDTPLCKDDRMVPEGEEHLPSSSEERTKGAQVVIEGL